MLMLHNYITPVLVMEDYPPYCLTQPIAEEFLATDLSDISRIIDGQFEAPLPIVFVAFPIKFLTDSDGDYVTHALIEIVTDIHGRRLLKVCCNLRRPGMPASSVSIASDHLFAITEKGLSYGRIVGLEDDEEALASFAGSPEGKLASIACQVMLILSIGDKYVDEGSAQPFAVRKRKGSGSVEGPKVPRIIRLPKTKVHRKGAPSGINNGQPRRPHWRKGHWRNQPYGPRNSLRKIIWMRPKRIGE